MDDADRLQNEKIQKELDAIMIKDSVLKESQNLFANKLTERIVFSFLALVGTAIAIKFLSLIGLSVSL